MMKVPVDSGQDPTLAASELNLQESTAICKTMIPVPPLKTRATN